MSQISEVNENILTKILKTDEFYQALWGKEDFTPDTTITTPDNYNCGAIANQLEYVYDFVREITGRELDELPEPYIDIVVYFFTGLKRFTEEADLDLIRRMESLIVREDNWRSERFGTPWDIKNVFSYYLDRDLLYYIPNAVLTDILINGDFEDVIAGEWTFNPSGNRSSVDAFEGDYKLDFTAFTDVLQTVAVVSGAYILNCFAKPVSGTPGDIFNLTIQRDSDSYYFNTSTLVWVSSDPNNKYTSISGDWGLAEFFILVDGTYNVDIKFTKIVDFLLDRIEFGLKLYPFYELVYIDAGPATYFASVWDAGIIYENASYLDQDAMFSSATSSYTDTYYQSLLDTVKASGIKGIFTREIRT